MQSREVSLLKEMVHFALLTIAIVLPIRLFVAEPFIVSGASMEPTFDTGEYLIVDRLSYRFEEPSRGEVIIFRYPLDPDKYFIKRIVGLPGETVELSGKEIRIKNSQNKEGFSLDQTYITHQRNDYLSFTLGPAQYFVLGDNRSASSDSRSWGTLPRENIVGRAFLRLFPLTKITVFPGAHTEK